MWPPLGDLACNPSMCPDWELNPWPFDSQPVLNPLSYTSQGNSVAIILNEGRIPHSLPVFTFVQGRIELLSKYPLYALSPIKIIVPPQYVGRYVCMYVCMCVLSESCWPGENVAFVGMCLLIGCCNLKTGFHTFPFLFHFLCKEMEDPFYFPSPCGSLL